MNNSVETKKAEVRNNIKNTLESAKIKIINVISVCPDWEVEYIDFGFKSLNVCLNLKGVERNRSLVIRYQKKMASSRKSLSTPMWQAVENLTLLRRTTILSTTQRLATFSIIKICFHS